ncbi:DinB family protein [Lacinutrix salivirga]
MHKDDIAVKLEKAHNNLLQFLSNQDEELWETGPEGKWTTGQQALHILQSLKPMNTALSMPKFLLRYKFGKTNRSVRNFTTVVKRYNEKLDETKDTTFGPSKNMKVPKLKDKKYLMDRLQTENKKLQYKTLKKWSDKDLDTYVLPHPLMGKMPVRELLMWTIYHIEHHTKSLETNY